MYRRSRAIGKLPNTILRISLCLNFNVDLTKSPYGSFVQYDTASSRSIIPFSSWNIYYRRSHHRLVVCKSLLLCFPLYFLQEHLQCCHRGVCRSRSRCQSLCCCTSRSKKQDSHVQMRPHAVLGLWPLRRNLD